MTQVKQKLKKEVLKTKTEIFKTKDLVIPVLDLPANCPISITITDNEVFLLVGPRDISWDRKTKKVNGSGCFFG